MTKYEIMFIVRSDIDEDTRKSTVANYPLSLMPVHTPETLVKDLKIELINCDGSYEDFAEISGNYRRVIKCNIGKKCKGGRITPISTHGSKEVRIFSVNAK